MTQTLQGDVWSADPAGWARQDDLQVDTYEAVAAGLGELAGLDVLEVGCATGRFLRLAVDRGARATGLDAAPGLVELARERVPEAEVVVGDLEALPFEDGAFDVVAGFNAFQFADDVVAALVEAARVTRPGGRVVVQMWGRPERCELLPVLGRLAPLLPFRAPGPPGGGNFSDAGVLERLAGQAGLEPAKRCSVTTTIAYADEEELLRVLMAAGLSQIAARAAGEDAVREAFRGAAAGKVRYANEWIWLVARKP